MKIHQLQRQESNLRPLLYESTMQPPTPRCDIKTTYLHRPVAVKKSILIQTKKISVGRKGVEPLSTGSEPVMLTITPPTENPATFTGGRVEIPMCNIKQMFNP